jgi:hypothetical protein
MPLDKIADECEVLVDEAKAKSVEQQQGNSMKSTCILLDFSNTDKYSVKYNNNGSLAQTGNENHRQTHTMRPCDSQEIPQLPLDELTPGVFI